MQLKPMLIKSEFSFFFKRNWVSLALSIDLCFENYSTVAYQTAETLTKIMLHQIHSQQNHFSSIFFLNLQNQILNNYEIFSNCGDGEKTFIVAEEFVSASDVFHLTNRFDYA